MRPGYWVKRLDEVPLVPTDDPADFDWYPIQHHFGISAFGVNVFAAPKTGMELVSAHDETESGQEELYVVMAGTARFTLADEDIDAPAVSLVAIPDPAVKRSAVAVESGTTLLVVGGSASAGFRTTWRPEHFERVPVAG